MEKKKKKKTATMKVIKKKERKTYFKPVWFDKKSSEVFRTPLFIRLFLLWLSGNESLQRAPKITKII